jgi:hypothetical protein
MLVAEAVMVLRFVQMVDLCVLEEERWGAGIYSMG